MGRDLIPSFSVVSINISSIIFFPSPELHPMSLSISDQTSFILYTPAFATWNRSRESLASGTWTTSSKTIWVREREGWRSRPKARARAMLMFGRFWRLQVIQSDARRPSAGAEMLSSSALFRAAASSLWCNQFWESNHACTYLQTFL